MGDSYSFFKELIQSTLLCTIRSSIFCVEQLHVLSRVGVLDIHRKSKILKCRKSTKKLKMSSKPRNCLQRPKYKTENTKPNFNKTSKSMSPKNNYHNLPLYILLYGISYCHPD